MSHEPFPWCKILLLSLQDEALICVCLCIYIFYHITSKPKENCKRIHTVKIIQTRNYGIMIYVDITQCLVKTHHLHHPSLMIRGH